MVVVAYAENWFLSGGDLIVQSFSHGVGYAMA
jgi:hypothetical protein